MATGRLLEVRVDNPARITTRGAVTAHPASRATGWRAMGTYFDLTISTYLRGDLTDTELATVRWMVGQGPEPDGLETLPGYVQPTPVVGDLHPRTVVDDTWLLVPGGEHVSLVAGQLDSRERLWSLSVHVLHGDDTFYQDVLPGLFWLATLTHRDGVYAWAHDRDVDLFPSWVVVAGDRRAYLMDGPELRPVHEEGLPAPASLSESLRRFVTVRPEPTV
jgi:hypothetical protein